MGWTPCDVVHEELPIGMQHVCPYGEPTGEMCRNCIADAENDYAEDEYPNDYCGD